MRLLLVGAFGLDCQLGRHGCGMWLTLSAQEECVVDRCGGSRLEIPRGFSAMPSKIGCVRKLGSGRQDHVTARGVSYVSRVLILCIQLA